MTDEMKTYTGVDFGQDLGSFVWVLKCQDGTYCLHKTITGYGFFPVRKRRKRLAKKLRSRGYIRKVRK